MVRILHLTDLHLGHLKVKTKNIRCALVDYLYPKLKEIDVLILGGDFFDNLVHFNSEDGFYAALVIEELKKQALQYGFYIRVLRGTFSHDRCQNRFFTVETLPLMLHDEPLVKVYDTITLDIIKHFQFSMLCIPDDIVCDIDEKVTDIMEGAGMDKVDIVVTHGYYEYMVPANVPKPKRTYRNDQFNTITKSVILNGHVHTHSVYGKIINTGSFDRLKHGEEEDKGFSIIKYDGRVRYEFVKNRAASIFKTINISGVDIDHISNHVTKLIEDIIKDDITFSDIFLRFVTDDEMVRRVVPSILRDYKKTVHVTFKSLKEEEHKELETYEYSDLPSINESNLSENILAFLSKFSIQIDKPSIDRVLEGSHG